VPFVVLNPAGASGVREALERLEGIELVCPGDADGVVRELRNRCTGDGSTVHVTTRPGWRNDFLVPGLRWVQSQSAGHETFPLEEFRRRQIILTSGSGLHAICSEHAMAMLLALTRDIHVASRDMTSRRWNHHMAAELGGRTIAIAGLGTIGEAIARRLQGWEVGLIGLTRSPQSYSGIVRDVRPLSALLSACSEASVLMIALPSNLETHHLISGPVLDALGFGYLVNVARGALVDETALIERLTDGRLAGAGLDVVEAEPLADDSPLWKLTNVVLTPHMAGRSPRHGERFAELMAQNLAAFQGTAPWRNRIC
jgi:phosphoglycerate dehydrogenase-like enzyme